MHLKIINFYSVQIISLQICVYIIFVVSKLFKTFLSFILWHCGRIKTSFTHTHSCFFKYRHIILRLIQVNIHVWDSILVNNPQIRTKIYKHKYALRISFVPISSTN